MQDAGKLLDTNKTMILLILYKTFTQEVSLYSRLECKHNNESMVGIL